MMEQERTTHSQVVSRIGSLNQDSSFLEKLKTTQKINSQEKRVKTNSLEDKIYAQDLEIETSQNENFKHNMKNSNAFTQDEIITNARRKISISIQQDNTDDNESELEDLLAFKRQNQNLGEDTDKDKDVGQFKTRAKIETPVPFKASVVSTLVGSNKGNIDGNGTNAKMNCPIGVAFNSFDNCLYVCEYKNDTIRKVTKSGQVSNFVDIPSPADIIFCAKQQCFFVSSHYSHSIKKVSMKGEISTLGEETNSILKFPCGLALNEETGDIYVADSNNHIIRKIDSKGIITTFAGTQGKKGHLNSGPKTSLFFTPYGICFHSQLQSLFVCDYGNNTLRRISLDGQVSTVCQILDPDFVTILSANTILVSSKRHIIWKVSFEGNNKVETEVFAGTGLQGYKDGPPFETLFYYPRGMAIDKNNNICFITDQGNHKIRAIKYVQ